MNQKRGFLGIPFAWLFAIIVGAFILFLAIFATVKITKTEQIALDASTAKEIGVLLNPLETGFETGKTTSMVLPSETRIYNRCDLREDEPEDYFGRQIIKLSQKSFGEWTQTDVDIGFTNKYVFSEGYVEGRKFYLFSKPFDFPFKVSDLIYLTSANKNYCFDNPPSKIENEIKNLNQGNLFTEDCPKDSVKVCFSGSCDIKVSEGTFIVEKNGKKLHFYGDTLMYAAIFSEPEVYDCQLKRVMQRAEQLLEIYNEKEILISGQGCNSNMASDLNSLKSSLISFKESTGLNDALIKKVEDIQNKNERLRCKLW